MKSSGFVVLRTPLLPFDAVVDWGAGLRAAACCLAEDEAALEDALRADQHLVRERLRALVCLPEVREAIALSSRAMADVLRERAGAHFQAAEGTLVRYVLRMILRPTPFGLMAGISSGDVGSGTRLELPPRALYRRSTRLDGGTLSAVTEALVADPGIRAETAFRPNPDLYELGGELRYFVAASPEAHSFRLNAVERTSLIDRALAHARKGARPLRIASALVSKKVGAGRARALVEAMIDARLLVSDVEAEVTGQDPLGEVARVLRLGKRAGQDAARKLERIQETLREADATLVPPEGAYTAAQEALASLVPDGGRAAFQVDLLKPAPDLRLGARIVSEVLAAVRVLHRIAARAPDATLARFRADFQRRYGSRQVRLVDALDPEHGIGCALAPAPAHSASWSEARLRLLHRAWTEGQHTLVLSAPDLDALSAEALEPVPPLPDALAALVTLAAASDTAMRRGDVQVVLHSVHGPSGARLLGRACLVDPALKAAVAAHLRAEEQLRPDALFVEIVWLPKQHHRNVVGRPVLREYELGFACRTGAPPAGQIALSDLLVGLAGERIELRSARLGREIVPRISCALNWTHPEGHPALRLLGALQDQGVASALEFDWGPFDAAPFLPRVRHGRAILSLARWRVPTAPLAAAALEGPTRAFRSVHELRAKLALPRYVSVDESGTPLTLDLDNPLCVDALLRIARLQEDLRITELFPGPEDLSVRGPEGSYLHELLVPFVAVKGAATAPPVSAKATVAREARARLPGTDWLFAKIYGSAGSADALLCGVIAPLLDRATRSGAVDRWFFVRYADPDPDLRIRAHGPSRRLAAELGPAIAAALKRLLDDGSVWRLTFDTYERELERYGGLDATTIAERVFALDSRAVTALLAVHPTLEERRDLAVLSVDRLLSALGLGLAAKTALVGRSRDALALEQGDESSRRECGAVFRAKRKTLATLLSAGYPEGASWARSFVGRDAGVARAARRLGALDRAGTLETPLAAIGASYVHLHVNRLFPTNQPRNELLILELLRRHYASERAR